MPRHSRHLSGRPLAVAASPGCAVAQRLRRAMVMVVVGGGQSSLWRKGWAVRPGLAGVVCGWLGGCPCSCSVALGGCRRLPPKRVVPLPARPAHPNAAAQYNMVLLRTSLPPLKSSFNPFPHAAAPGAPCWPGAQPSQAPHFALAPAPRPPAAHSLQLLLQLLLCLSVLPGILVQVVLRQVL